MVEKPDDNSLKLSKTRDDCRFVVQERFRSTTRQSLAELDRFADFAAKVCPQIYWLIVTNPGTLFLAGMGQAWGAMATLSAAFMRKHPTTRDTAVVLLGSNSSVLTATANDYGPDFMFLREFQASVKQEDVLLVLAPNAEPALKYMLKFVAISGAPYSVVLTSHPRRHWFQEDELKSPKTVEFYVPEQSIELEVETWLTMLMCFERVLWQMRSAGGKLGQ
jgi:phosphoheptose isomerase